MGKQLRPVTFLASRLSLRRDAQWMPADGGESGGTASLLVRGHTEMVVLNFKGAFRQMKNPVERRSLSPLARHPGLEAMFVLLAVPHILAVGMQAPTDRNGIDDLRELFTSGREGRSVG